MRLFFFDTETNGLPKSDRASPYDTKNWPIILTIGWQIWDVKDGEWTLFETGEHLLKPDDSVVWDAGAEAIHGISRTKAITEGVPSAEVIPGLQTLLRSVDVAIAHNIAFDKSVLFAESLRLDGSARIDWWPRLEFCTCQNTKALCKLPSRAAKPRPDDPYKKPKLVELYEFLYGGVPTDIGFHTVGGDVECLVRCFREMVRRGHVPIAVWERATRRV